MLLAAGRGERMRPLTDHCPKPLLSVQGRPLLAWHLQALAQAGVARAVINTAWLGEQISSHFGDVYPGGKGGDSGDGFKGGFKGGFGPQGASGLPGQLSILYSHEGRDFGHALETAGGIARAIAHLGPLFWLAAGDVFAPDFVFDAAIAQRFAASADLAHLWLVANPEHHRGGDFGLSDQARALNLPDHHPGPRYTYSTIALLKRELFTQPWCALEPENPQGIPLPLGPLLRRAMDADRVSAEIYRGRWTDVGTPERLAAIA